ncbi:lipocalin family protein [Pedobacter sp. SYP-B3415]|uniref:lipocalin family protein n=1 Tax=Pedobacter sp. SYP-B3415 TaxID=2496641 RepID=UPI00101DB5DB|nr:lipocalin family protein [Pedobacter sp. SYP-B3415]
MENAPVERVDVVAFAGRWYTLYSIPSFFDSHWRRTVHTHVIHPDGYYAVFSTYQVQGETQRKYLRSKLRIIRGSNNARLKSTFFWPLTTDYWIIERADDYSYVVIGHPRNKHLSILSRQPSLDRDLLQQIVARCKQRGYDTRKLASQGFSS